MMDDKEIQRKYLRYNAIGLLVNCVMIVASTALGWLLDWKTDGPVVVSGAFTFIVITAVGYLWRWVAGKHPDSLPTFFTTVSGFRMLLALFTLLGCYIAVGRDAMMPYVVVFMTFYLVQVGFHSIYFARITNKL